MILMIKNNRGASLVDYGIIVALISVIAVSAVSALGGNIRDIFGMTEAELASKIETALLKEVDTPPVPDNIFDHDDYILLTLDDPVHQFGRLPDFEDSEQITVVVDFHKTNFASNDQRIVWNHTRFGIQLMSNGVSIKTANDGGIPFWQGIDITGLDLAKTDRHVLKVALDTETDRMQVVLDGAIIYDQTGERDFKLQLDHDYEWGWMLGSPWGHEFEGGVYSFSVSDAAIFQ